MERREKYDPEDIEFLLTERGFDELLTEERAYVLRHVADREEYETMRALLLHMRNSDQDQAPLVPEPRVRTNVINAFRAEQKPQWQVWLNSIGTLFWPKDMADLWRPALAFASLALLIVAGVAVVRNYGAKQDQLAELHVVKEQKVDPAENAEVGLDNEESKAFPVPEEKAKESLAEVSTKTITTENIDAYGSEPIMPNVADEALKDIQAGLTVVEDNVKFTNSTANAAPQPMPAATREKSEEYVYDVAETEDVEYAPSGGATIDLVPAAAEDLSHVVTDAELARNVSTSNSNAKRTDLVGMTGASATSRNLAADAALLALMTTGW